MINGRRLSVAVLLVACALLFVAPAAEARIVPQKGIMGINLLMTRSAVIDAKGKPDAERVVQNEIIGPQRVMRYGRTRASFNGVGKSARVIGVTTRDRRQRTRSGIGVGSTQRAVRRRVRGVRCAKQFGFRHCWKGSFQPGNRVTDFAISEPARRVWRVTVGFVID